jgi:hypothetical protein
MDFNRGLHLRAPTGGYINDKGKDTKDEKEDKKIY